MFLFSKIFGLLLNPLLWITAALVAGIWTGRPVLRRRLLGAALAMLLFFSNGWMVRRIVSRYQPRPVAMAMGERHGLGILLSGMAGYDRGTREAYFLSSADRFIQAARLYRLGHVRKLLVSGGNGNPFARHDFRESDFLAENLQTMGVRREDIIVENASRNTIENAAFSRRLLDSLGLGDTAVLITSAIHMPRAKAVFESQGMRIRPFPCDYLVRPSGSELTWLSLLPASDAFMQWEALLRELAGRMFLRLRPTGKAG